MHQYFTYNPKHSFLLLRFSFCIVIFFAIFLLSSHKTPALAQTTNTQEAKKIIRIGYQPERAFYTTRGTTGQEGYGYEYMQKILYYTQNEYTPVYVPVSWGEGLEMLKKGAIDILPFALYTEKRAQDFLYSTHPLTTEKPVLFSLKNDNIQLSSDYNELHGSRICIYENNSFYDEFLDFLNEKQIYPLLIKVPYTPFEQLQQEAEYDYILGSSLLLGYNIADTLGLESKPSYILANKENAELLADIDYALAMIDKEDFLFRHKLLIKYFHYLDNRKENLTQLEKESIVEKEYRVGVMNMDAPISFVTDEGQVAGVFVDVINRLAELGNFKVTFETIPHSVTDDIINTFDFSFLPFQRPTKQYFPTSDVFGSNSFILVTGSDFKKHSEHTVGTLSHFNMNFQFTSTFIGGKANKFVEYLTNSELIDAFNTGKIDSIVITRAIYNTIHTSLTTNTITELGISYFVPISFSQDFPKEKIKIINKLISHINQTTIDDYTMRNVVLMTRHNATHYLVKYWYIILFICILICIIFFVFYRRIQKQKAYELKLAQDINPVTGVYTFAKFLIEARNFINNHPNTELRIFTVDIDNFSFINEFFGFEAGSKILKQMAHHLQDRVKDFSPIANYGGDNFAVITYKRTNNVKDFVNYLQLDKLQSTLEATLLHHSNLSLSFGVYDIIDRTLEVSYMVDCADIACHKSKDFFGTHAFFYTEEMKEENIRQHQMLNLINTALENKEFELFYQPKFDIDHMHVVGAEALIRWFKDGKMIPPDKFIPIAEKHGLINTLDYHVIELACDFISSHKKECLPHISINISGFTIIKSELVDKLIEITTKYNVKPQELDIEITETALVNNFDMAINQILALRELGFTISMDDFGTGVSSLNRLSQMPLDTIKLDRVFLMDALENKKSSVIVQTVIELAKKIDAKTVAEGIETQEQLDLLRELSCEHGQGYFYARPMSEKNFLEYLEEEK